MTRKERLEKLVEAYDRQMREALDKGNTFKADQMRLAKMRSESELKNLLSKGDT